MESEYKDSLAQAEAIINDAAPLVEFEQIVQDAACLYERQQQMTGIMKNVLRKAGIAVDDSLDR